MTIKLSDGEKLIVALLCDIHRNMNIAGGDSLDPQFIMESIYGGHDWALKWKYPGIFEAESTPSQTVTEVCNVLDMWWMLEIGYEALSQPDKDRVAAEADPFGANVRFRGFDGNNETRHMTTAEFLIEQLGRWRHFTGRDLNSHAPSIDGYLRMYPIFERIRQNLHNRTMNADEIIAILRERVHPDHR